MGKTRATTFKGFTINTDEGKYACNEYILEQYGLRIQHLLSGHSRVLQKSLISTIRKTVR